MVTTFANSLNYRVSVERDQAQPAGANEISLIDLLVWAYRDQRVLEDSLAHDEARYLSVGNGLGALERLLELGCAVDGGGRSRHEAHRDAQAIHARLLRLAGRGEDAAYAVALVIECAKVGRQPEPPMDLREIVRPRMKAGRGGIMMSYWDVEANPRWPDRPKQLDARPNRKLRGRDGQVCRVGQACEIVYDQEAVLERHLADNFALWRVALQWLGRNLPLLTKWKVKEFQGDGDFHLTIRAALLQQLC